MRDELYCTPSSRIVNINYETPMEHKVGPTLLIRFTNFNFKLTMCLFVKILKLLLRGFSLLCAMNNLWRHKKIFLPRGRRGQGRNDWSCDLIDLSYMCSRLEPRSLPFSVFSTKLSIYFCTCLWPKVNIYRVFFLTGPTQKSMELVPPNTEKLLSSLEMAKIPY